MILHLAGVFQRYIEQKRCLIALLTENYPSEGLEKKVHRARWHHYDGVGDHTFLDKPGVSTENLAVKCDSEKPSIDIQTTI